MHSTGVWPWFSVTGENEVASWSSPSNCCWTIIPSRLFSLYGRWLCYHCAEGGMKRTVFPNLAAAQCPWIQIIIYCSLPYSLKNVTCLLVPSKGRKANEDSKSDSFFSGSPQDNFFFKSSHFVWAGKQCRLLCEQQVKSLETIRFPFPTLRLELQWQPLPQPCCAVCFNQHFRKKRAVPDIFNQLQIHLAGWW